MMISLRSLINVQFQIFSLLIEALYLNVRLARSNRNLNKEKSFFLSKYWNQTCTITYQVDLHIFRRCHGKQ